MKALWLIALHGFLLVTEFVGLSLSGVTNIPPPNTTTRSPIRPILTLLPILFILFLFPMLLQGIGGGGGGNGFGPGYAIFSPTGKKWKYG
ncbi:hypothetical protein CHS0354_041283 [Potamilus streckersoni]|uniref:Glycine-rich protein n=1 Tax=Potamilus streckersoni TaxID=2493646 RepID=A0AAE0VU86_9BIVA|nr:hypothetical protein CHS0354_041283 [Potamilus streckersoni]